MRTQLLLRDSTAAFARREAKPRPSTFDAKARTVDAVIATGAHVPRTDHEGAYLEILDVAGADLAALRGASVLNSHTQSDLDATACSSCSRLIFDVSPN